MSFSNHKAEELKIKGFYLIIEQDYSFQIGANLVLTLFYLLIFTFWLPFWIIKLWKNLHIFLIFCWSVLPMKEVSFSGLKTNNSVTRCTKAAVRILVFLKKRLFILVFQESFGKKNFLHGICRWERVTFYYFWINDFFMLWIFSNDLIGWLGLFARLRRGGCLRFSFHKKKLTINIWCENH